ncbi:MAG TPA: RNA methyltransferase [Burkholderiales bacterium]|nr:RNA methyltransferase [Burkholderiales bacterium]
MLKLVRRLAASARDRRRLGKTLLDGAHLVQAYARRLGLQSATLILSDTASKSAEVADLLSSFEPGRLVTLPDSLFEALAPVQTPTGVLAVVDIPRVERKPKLEGFWVLLQGVQDPGNLGSILRTAAAIRAAAAALCPACADPWSPKCLRGGMGAHFVLPIVDRADLWKLLEGFPGKVYATAPRSGPPLFDVDLTGSCAVLFGAEGQGLDKDLLNQADATIRIPISEWVESLNVAAAVAMVCCERLRQEGFSGRK